MYWDKIILSQNKTKLLFTLLKIMTGNMSRVCIRTRVMEEGGVVSYIFVTPSTDNNT